MRGTLAISAALAVFAFLFSPPAFAEVDLIERGIRHFDELIKRYPPDKFHIIGLGPTTVVQSASARAKLGHDWQDYFTELPVAYFNEFETLSHETRLSLLPTAKTVRGRTVVVFRVLMMGASMRHYLPDFADMLKREKITPNVEGYFIAPTDVSDSEPFFPDWGRDRSRLPPVTVVHDDDYSTWLNTRNLDHPEATIHGQTYYKLISLDELVGPALFERNPLVEKIDRLLERLKMKPCRQQLPHLVKGRRR